jgi:L-ascorbate metabolism protein UlaG (beta-lactamase superfamily)
VEMSLKIEPMNNELTLETFSDLLNTKFQVTLDTPGQVDLELAEVKNHRGEDHEQDGTVQFSLFFTGSTDFFLPQGTYQLGHERMEGFDIFLVPIGRNEHAFRYQAVFNYLKSASTDSADSADQDHKEVK